MIKNIASAALSLGLAMGLSACAAFTGPGGGLLYTEAKLPSHDLEVNSETTLAAKTGSATCTNILGLIATGDCSVETAKKNGGISRVSSAQWDVKNILGIYAEYHLKVLGN
jgi:hypothetical protein